MQWKSRRVAGKEDVMSWAVLDLRSWGAGSGRGGVCECEESAQFMFDSKVRLGLNVGPRIAD